MFIDLPTAAGGVRAFTGGKPFDPALPAVVFLHGAGMDHTSWTPHARWFAHHGRGVLALDLPGHGGSAAPALRTIADHARALIQVLDAAGVATAALVGHSLGSLIALETAARHPDRVRALALVGSSSVMAVNSALIETARTDLPAAADLIVDWSFGPHATFGPSPTPGLSLPELGRRVLARSRPGTLHADLSACDTYASGAAACARLSCPTLVVTGAFDRMTTAGQGRQLAAAIPGARLAEIPGIGHMHPLEAPEALLEALKGAV